MHKIRYCGIYRPREENVRLTPFPWWKLGSGFSILAINCVDFSVHCFTSLVSFTGFYTEDEPGIILGDPGADSGG